MPDVRHRVAYAQLLTDGSELQMLSDPVARLHAPAADARWLQLTEVKLDPVVPVIGLFLKDTR